ncbi:hypothetical protein ACGFZP_17275 [Kitasatospora sp. NPDC048239]|uniref:hypothetical protein n=1 Tax=Kitasatospora sp. NPDC048239 TaxID=3364046 RepID=UPI00370FC52A
MSSTQVVPAVEQPSRRTAPETAPVRPRVRTALVAVRPAGPEGSAADGPAAAATAVRSRAAHCRFAVQYLD